MTDINKYDRKTLAEYWSFINQLSYDCETQDAYSTKCSIMKKLSPSTAELYKDITDALAFSLYREVYCDKKNSYLYACYDAISRGQRFYEDCWMNADLIKPLEARLNAELIQEKNFSNVFPIEDEFFTKIEEVLDTCEFEDIDNSNDYKKNGKDLWKGFNQFDDEF